MRTKAEAEAEAREIVNGWVLGSAGVGWIPGSSVLLSAGQYQLCADVAHCFGVEDNDFESTFAGIAGAVIGRTAADAILSFVPVLGWAVKAGVAAATTKAIGEAVIAHYRAQSPLPDGDAYIHAAPDPVQIIEDAQAYRPPALPTPSSTLDNNLTPLEPPPPPVALEFTGRPRMSVFSRSGNTERKFAEVELGMRARGSFAAIQGAAPPLSDIEYEWNEQTASLLLHISATDDLRVRPYATGKAEAVKRARPRDAAVLPVGPGDDVYLGAWRLTFR